MDRDILDGDSIPFLFGVIGVERVDPIPAPLLVEPDARESVEG
jgi:hypothetical protein